MGDAPRRTGDGRRRDDEGSETGRDGSGLKRAATPAKRIFATMAAAGAKSYVRARDLPKLIALWPRELEDESEEGRRLVLGSSAAR